MKITFNDFKCVLKKAEYSTTYNTALVLVDERDGEEVAFCTINLPMELDKNHVAIKDYSENTGMLKTLVDAGVVLPPYAMIPSGHILVPVCQLSINLDNIAEL